MPRPPQTKQQLIQTINKLKSPKVVLLAEDTPFELSKALRLMKQKLLTVIVIESTLSPLRWGIPGARAVQLSQHNGSWLTRNPPF